MYKGFACSFSLFVSFDVYAKKEIMEELICSCVVAWPKTGFEEPLPSPCEVYFSLCSQVVSSRMCNKLFL